MKKTFLKVVLIAASLFAATVVNAETPISFSGQIGYASPSGGWFKNAAGEKMSKFGLGWDFDALWHFEQMDYKLGAGITYNGSALFGADLDNEQDVNIGIYGLSLYGVKGQYRFFNSKVSPYGALSLGLSQFSTPEVTMTDGYGNETVIAESESAFGFGIRPEIGVEFGAFVISAAYIIPMKYKFENTESKSAGALQINLGARISLFDRD